MKKKGIICAFLLSVCAFTSWLGIKSTSVKAETVFNVTATAAESVIQGDLQTCYVYIDSLSGISALDVSVYFDSEKVSVSGAYNDVACLVYDNAVNESNVTFSYVFDGNGAENETLLFYFFYTALDRAEVGETYFDIVIGEAYDAKLNVVSVKGGRIPFRITEKIVTKQCSIYGNSTVSTSVQGEFSLAYSLSDYQIASGAFSIVYDAELFELVSVARGGFLSNKAVDINKDLVGAVYVSFVGTEYTYSQNVITVTFKTIKNVEVASQVELKVSEFYDLNLALVACNGFETTVNIAFDETYTGDSPSVVISASYSSDTTQVTAKVKIAKDSTLGAGDFVLSFDPSVLKLHSYQKEFSPSFFNVNDKESASGKLKFSIISLSDITSEEVVISVTFDTVRACNDVNTAIKISGSGLTDSLTNPILLHFVNAKVVIPLRHVEKVLQRKEPNCEETGLTEGICCSACGVVLKTQQIIDALGHDYGSWKAEVSATCEGTGTKGHYHCSVCEKDFDEHKKQLSDLTIAVLGHDYGTWVSNNDGTHTKTCSHDSAHTVTENCHGGTATCTEKATCEDCNEKYGDLKPHVYNQKNTDSKYLKTAATCEGKAVYYYSCVCGEKGTETFESGDVLGHDYGDWVSNGDGTHTKTCSHDSAHTVTESCHGGTAMCTEKATCEDCNEKYGELKTHVYNQKSTDSRYLKTAATCEGKAVYYYSCVCGEKGTETFESGEVLGHDYVDWVSNGDGTHTKTCSHDSAHTVTENCHGGTAMCTEKATCEDCNEKYGELKTHVYNQKNTDSKYLKTAATCEGKAVYYYSCVCGEKGTEKFESGEVLGHDYGDWVSNGDGTHTKMCSHDSAHTVTENCHGNTATCTEKATCEDCNEKYGELKTHVYNQKNTDSKYLKIAATCEGKAVYYYSCVCGEKGTETFESGEALGHSFTNYVSDGNATCESDGTKTANCDHDNCNKTDTVTDDGSTLGHDYGDWVCDKEATKNEEGHEYRECKTCGERDDRSIEKLKDGQCCKSSVQSGYGIGTVVIVCFAVLLIRKKIRR